MTSDNEQKHKALLIDYKMAFASEHGKRVLANLREVANVDRPHFYPGPIDTTALVIAEARRGLVLEILAKVNADIGQGARVQVKTEDGV
jgi:hypothetical protein